jgi:hypothetical protein
MPVEPLAVADTWRVIGSEPMGVVCIGVLPTGIFGIVFRALSNQSGAPGGGGAPTCGGGNCGRGADCGGGGYETAGVPAGLLNDASRAAKSADGVETGGGAA